MLEDGAYGRKGPEATLREMVEDLQSGNVGLEMIGLFLSHEEGRTEAGIRAGDLFFESPVDVDALDAACEEAEVTPVIIAFATGPAAGRLKNAADEVGESLQDKLAEPQATRDTRVFLPEAKIDEQVEEARQDLDGEIERLLGEGKE